MIWKRRHNSIAQPLHSKGFILSNQITDRFLRDKEELESPTITIKLGATQKINAHQFRDFNGEMEQM
jgi:hypothetical protein